MDVALRPHDTKSKSKSRGRIILGYEAASLSTPCRPTAASIAAKLRDFALEVQRRSIEMDNRELGQSQKGLECVQQEHTEQPDGGQKDRAMSPAPTRNISGKTLKGGSERFEYAESKNDKSEWPQALYYELWR